MADKFSLVKTHLADAISYLEAIIHVHDCPEWKTPDTRFWELLCLERVEWSRELLQHPSYS